MHAITQQVAAELDVLYGLYQLALDYTGKIKPEEEGEVLKWLQTRQRILGKTDIASKNAGALLKVFKTTKNIPANEQALILEKKKMIRDLLTTLRKTEFDLMKKMRTKMDSLRGELADVTRKNQAASAYVNAPRPKLMAA